MRLMAAPGEPLLFNVGAVVGKGGVNATEDVLLVQFLLRKWGETRKTLGAGFAARIAKVPINGIVDEATIDGIRAVQEDMRELSPANVVDGRVSPAQGSFAYGSGIYTIATLNVGVRSAFPNAWPRLQDIKDCPALLQTKVREVL